ncbi:hypothetical protein D3C81_2093510 [compost metagenome]
MYSERLAPVIASIRGKVPAMNVDRPIAPDMASVAELIRSSELVEGCPDLQTLF